MIDSAAVTAQLTALEPQVRQLKPAMWACSFESEGTKQEVLLFESTNSGYFVAISPIFSDQLESLPSGLTHQTLVTLLEVGSTVPLAKVDFREFGQGKFLYSALSYCSNVGWSADKLLRRMRDVATLAARVEAGLAKREPHRNVG
jgi:hypothetical protein